MGLLEFSDLMVISPVVFLSVGALLVLLMETLTPRGSNADLKYLLSFLIVFFALVALELSSSVYGFDRKALGGLVYADPLSAWSVLILLVGGVLALGVGQRALEREGVSASGEYYSLFLMSLAGALVFATSAELVTLFLGLELMSMPLYCLCGAALFKRESVESALKYFLLGSFSSAFLLYGIAVLYGLTGTTVIADIAVKLSGADPAVVLFAATLLVVGLGFKLALVPFHFWAPDVYQGAPTSITTYMATVIKAAAVLAALRVIWGGFSGFIDDWAPIVWLLAVATMTVGNFAALRQRNLKRMLAYSSIAHAGYMLVAFLALEPGQGGGAAVLYYLVAYLIMTTGAFGVLIGVAQGNKPGEELDHFANLGRRQPILAAVMSLFMLSLAGIPPGMAGLVGKFFLFSAAVRADFVGLAIIGVLNSAVSCYYYLRVVVVMYFRGAEAETEDSTPEWELRPSLQGVLAVCALLVVSLGIFPAAVLESAEYVIEGLSAW